MRKGVDLRPVRADAQEDIRRMAMPGEAAVIAVGMASTVRASATITLFMIPTTIRMAQASHLQRLSSCAQLHHQGFRRFSGGCSSRDHWVRLTSYGPQELGSQPARLQSVSQSAPGQPGSHVGSPSTRLAARSASGEASPEETQPPAELPPAILVFRDGHQEEAAKYTIVGNTIFIKTDYWSSGSWTHEIPIAQLDIPATLRANQARGTKFSLPSRRGEVMMRP
jgi:hypothetical protein